LSGRSGTLRIWLCTGQLLLRRAAHSESFWWIIAGGPLSAMLLTGFSNPATNLPSALVWTIPCALIIGWPSSPVREGLVAQLGLTWAGRGATKVPELILPTLISSAIVMLYCYVSGLYGLIFVPWQTYIIIPFSALLASSVILIIETRFALRGRTLLCLLFAGQFLHVPGSGGFTELLLLPGYTLFSLTWGNGRPTGSHADTYMALAVFAGVLMVYVSGRFSK
jgi:hypothetical protein